MKKTLIVFASLLLLSAAGGSEDLQGNANEAKYYDNAKVVRIKTIQGEGFVQRSYDDGHEEATANLPLFEKDTAGTTDGRMSIYLGRLNYLRLDVDTTVILEKVPQLRRTDLAVRLEQGSICLDVENLDQEKSIEVQTPDCGIFLLDKGVYRINADGERTEVLVLEGVAEVAGRDSGRNVRENQKIVMAGGEMAERPYYFTASEKDDFDRWNDEQNRELGYARYGSSRYLQSGYEDDEYEMSRSGRWTYMSEFGSYAWCPYNTGADWMPYANGRWVWNPYYGYVWVSYDPCGWFTHHYGRWHWSYAHGWHWIPSYHWSPAWVSWFWNDSYYGWCPLSWWNRPVIIVHDRWDRHYDYHRGIPHHSRSTIIIRKHELSAANMRRVAVNKAALGQNGLIAYRGSAPGGRLESAKVTVINARGRSLTYKQGAIVSAEKYRAQGSDLHSAVYRYDAAPTGFKSVRRALRTGEGALRAKSAGESSDRVRYVPSTTDAAGSRAYGGQSGDSGESGTAVVRKSGSSGGSSGSRSRSGSSSSSSGSSSGTAVKKKKGGEPSFLSHYSSGYSSWGGPSGTAAAAGPAPAARSSFRSFASGRVVYRSFGSAASGEAAPASGRRFIGTIVSSRSAAGTDAPSYGASARSRAYATDDNEAVAGGGYSGLASASGSSSSSGGRSWSSTASGVSRASSGSSRSYAGAAYGSGSHSSSVSRHSSGSSPSSASHRSSGSSSNSSGRAVKKN
jgi:hypothetical protein